MNYLNPFSGIIETHTFPHARTLRTTLRRKIRDAFYVFNGKRGGKMGLLDYATFLAYPLLTIGLIGWAHAHPHNRWARILFFSGMALAYFIFGIKWGLAALLTAIISPIVATVHLFSLIRGHQLKSALQENPTLYPLFDDMGNKSYTIYTVSNDKPRSASVLVMTKTPTQKEMTEIRLEIDEHNLCENKPALQAMAELNIDGFASKIEGNNYLGEKVFCFSDDRKIQFFAQGQDSNNITTEQVYYPSL